MNQFEREPNGETLLFPCAGAAYCGRVAYQAALSMTNDGTGQVYCLAAVAAAVEEKVVRTRQAARRVAIDGCEDRCSQKTLDIAGMPADVHLVLTDFGIEKKPAQPRVTADAARVAAHLGGLLQRLS